MFKFISLCFILIIQFSLQVPTMFVGEISEIGEKAVKASMIYDSRSAYSFIFKDSTLLEQLEIDNDKTSIQEVVQMNGIFIPSLELNLIQDPFIVSNGYSGSYGLGISQSFKNVLFDTMDENKILKNKQISLEMTGKETRVTFNFEEKETDLHQKYCKLAERKDLSPDYKESWVCEFSHSYASKEDSFPFENAIEINGRVSFDTTSYYITIPIEFGDTILNMLNIYKYSVFEKTDDSGYIRFYDNFTQSVINNLPSLYFILDGVAYGIKGSSLFEFENNNLFTYLRFKKDKNNIWDLGFPFFRNFKITFDYDSYYVGINGDKIKSFEKDYENWKKEIENNLNDIYTDKNIIIVGLIAGIAILVFVLFLVIRTCCRKESQTHSELIEEHNYP